MRKFYHILIEYASTPPSGGKTLAVWGLGKMKKGDNEEGSLSSQQNKV